MKFDIILPTIGRKSLLETIKSVIAQEIESWRLWIVADNCHLDHDWPMELDKRIEVCEIHTLPRNSDYGARARNYGIRQGDAPWIAYIDDDDVWLPNHLTILSECVKLRTDANMLRTYGRSFSWRHKSPRSSKLVRKLGPVNDRDILTVGMAHARKLFEKTTGWQPVDNHDHILWGELLAAGGVSAIIPEVTFEFER